LVMPASDKRANEATGADGANEAGVPAGPDGVAIA